MPCTPPFYPSPGHENRLAHDAASLCFYYLVCVGYVCGVFTNSWIARHQVEQFGGGYQKSFRTWDDLILYWDQWCATHHGPRCLAIAPPPPGFTTVPDPAFPPGPVPCTVPGTAPHPTTYNLPSAAASASSASTSASTSCCSSLEAMLSTPRATSALAVVVSRAASEDSYSECTSASSLSDTTSLFTDDEDENAMAEAQTQTQSEPPTPKKEEPRSPSLFSTPCRHHGITMDTLVLLSPSGYARAAEVLAGPAVPPNSPVTRGPRQPLAALLPVFVPGPLHLEDAADSHNPTPSNLSDFSTPAATPTPDALAPSLSLLVTPNPRTPATPAPSTPVRQRQYGIRGVAVFYSSNSAARAAAARLGIADPKIMVSDNDAKLEAWMTNRPFVGEDS